MSGVVVAGSSPKEKAAKAEAFELKVLGGEPAKRKGKEDEHSKEWVVHINSRELNAPAKYRNNKCEPTFG